MAYFERTGSGYTETPIAYPMDYPGIMVPADLNGDGNSDFIITNGATVGPDIILKQSSGLNTYYGDQLISNQEGQVFGISINDFNGDDLLDIASLNYQGDEVKWFENLGEVLSVPEVTDNEILIYPNPASNRLYFNGIDIAIDIQVFDVLGKLVISEEIQPGNSLDVRSLRNGVYLLRINELNANFKFIKE